jgi:hypothetical protein
MISQTGNVFINIPYWYGVIKDGNSRIVEDQLSRFVLAFCSYIAYPFILLSEILPTRSGVAEVLEENWVSFARTFGFYQSMDCVEEFGHHRCVSHWKRTLSFADRDRSTPFDVCLDGEEWSSWLYWTLICVWLYVAVVRWQYTRGNVQRLSKWFWGGTGLQCPATVCAFTVYSIIYGALGLLVRWYFGAYTASCFCVTLSISVAIFTFKKAFVCECYNSQQAIWRTKFHKILNHIDYGRLPDCSHPEAAQERTVSRNVCYDWIARVLKKSVFVMDMSLCDVQKIGKTVRAGQRSHYVDKDLTMPCFNDEPQEGDVLCFHDSEYRRDMGKYVSKFPCLMYSFIPESVGGPIKNGDFYIDQNDVSHSRFCGGEVQSHPHWDWMQSHFSVPTWFGRYVVLCETKRVSEHRYLIFTIPIAWVPWFYRSPSDDGGDVLLEAAKPLQRIKFNHWVGANTSVLVLQKKNPETGILEVSFGQPSCAISYTVSLEEFNAMISCYLRTAKAHRGTHIIQKYVKERYKPTERTSAIQNIYSIIELLSDNITAHSCYFPCIKSVGGLGVALKDLEDPDVPDNANYHQLDGSHDLSKPVIRSVGPPMFGNASGCGDSEYSQLIAVHERINAPREKIVEPSQEIADEYRALNKMFQEDVLGVHKDSMYPLPFDEVNDLMAKPSQRADYLRVIGDLVDMMDRVDAFVKKEPMNNPSKAGRIIQPMSKDHKVYSAQYSLAYAKILKTMDWYAFGKTPREIADRVHEVCHKFATAAVSDYSSYDTTHGELAYELWESDVVYVTAEEHKEAVAETLRKECDLIGRTPLGKKFDTRKMNCSGSTATSNRNSTMNAKKAWFALYKTAIKLGYQNPRLWATERLGVYGGDDGMTMEIDVECYKQVARDLGFILKVESSGPTNEPITFLARTYSNPSAHNGSMSDVPRAAKKLHLTTANKDVSDFEVMARKALALSITDANTPLLSQVSALMARTAGPQEMKRILEKLDTGKINPELNWIANQCLKEEGRYPPIPDPDEAISVVCNSLDLGADEFSALLQLIENSKTYWDLKPMFGAKDSWIAKYPTLYNGQFFNAGEGLSDGDWTGTPTETPEIQEHKKQPKKKKKTKVVQVASASNSETVVVTTESDDAKSASAEAIQTKTYQRGFGTNARVGGSSLVSAKPKTWKAKTLEEKIEEEYGPNEPALPMIGLSGVAVPAVTLYQTNVDYGEVDDLVVVRRVVSPH